MPHPSPRIPRGGDCSFTECGRRVQSRALCKTHYEQLLRGEDLKPIRPKAADGAGHINPRSGYRYFNRQDHPNASKNGLVAEHQVVMSAMLGRPLRKGENVHHKNGVKHDNRESNLELWVTMQPAGQRPQDLIEYAHLILDRYEEEFRTDAQTKSVSGSAGLSDGGSEATVSPAANNAA